MASQRKRKRPDSADDDDAGSEHHSEREGGSEDKEEVFGDGGIDMEDEEERGRDGIKNPGAGRAGGKRLEREGKEDKKAPERKEAKSRDTLAPNGQQWTVIDGIPADNGRRSLYTPALNVQAAYSSVKTKLSLNNAARLTSFDFFLCLFPMSLIGAAVTATAAAWKGDKMGAPPLAWEILTFFGYIVSFAVSGRPVAEHWPGCRSPKYNFLPSLNWSKYGLTHNRFRNIAQCLSFTTSPPAGEDKWHEVRPLIDGFNTNRANVWVAGTCLTVDELMSRWRGADGAFDPNGAPHVTKIIRKPEPVGIEIRCLICSASGVMLQLLIMEGKASMKAKLVEGLSAGCNSVYLLCQPWFNTGRMVAADSAFASVHTVLEMRKRAGLNFMGCVKTAYSMFPKKYLEDYVTVNKKEKPNPAKYPSRGSHVVLSTTIDNTQIFAIGWGDHKIKSIITATGSSAAGPHHEKRTVGTNAETGERETRITKVPCPQIVHDYFESAKGIDVHNHLRQDLLDLEGAWPTHKWHHRIFATVLGIIVTDCFRAHQNEYPETLLTVKSFADQLAWELIMNPWRPSQDQPAMPRRSSAPAGEDNKEETPVSVSPIDTAASRPPRQPCVLIGIKFHSKYVGKLHKQLECHICGEQTSYHCKQCSLHHDRPVPVCKRIREGREACIKSHEEVAAAQYF